MRELDGAHRERRFLLEKQPHLTNWVPIAVPVRSWIQWPPPFGHPIFAIAPLVLPFIFKFYDSLSGFTCPPSHVMSKARATRKFPQLGTDVKYVQVFYEGQHNDARTNVAIALTAAEQGACVANHVEATGLIFVGLLAMLTGVGNFVVGLFANKLYYGEWVPDLRSDVRSAPASE